MFKITGLKIGTRLFLGFGLVLLCSGLLLVLGLRRRSDLNRNVEGIVANMVRSLSSSLQTREIGWAIASFVRKIVMSTDAFEGARQKKLQENQLAACVKLEEELQRLASNPQSRTLLAETIASRQAVILGIQKINSLILEGNYFDASSSLRTDFIVLHENRMASVVKLVDHHQAELCESYDASLCDHRQATLGLLAVGLLTLAIGRAIFVFIKRTSTCPLKYAAHNDDTIASADLTESIELGSSDEARRLANSLSTMRRSPVGTVNHIKPHTEAISTASLDIALGSAGLSASKESQAGCGDTAFAMEGLTSEVKHDAVKRQLTVTANQDWEGGVRSRSIGLGMRAYYPSGASADSSVRRFSTKEHSAYSTVLWQSLIGGVDAENDAEWSSRPGLHTCCRHTQVFSLCRRLAGDGGAANADSYAFGFTSTVLGALPSRAVGWV